MVLHAAARSLVYAILPLYRMVKKKTTLKSVKKITLKQSL